MRLKSLEIKGFKSFPDETIIHFNESVTGIVGPNGSGKSNIVDAIRWVLGEQKGKELRLEHMQDVIFNGTKKRKEAALAQVSLSFDNTKNIIHSDYQTITISRLLYRSGDSEYRLNGVTCRLKDITSLLMDTGIGSDSYAIIALGMVEDILSNKESARRKMFEQAAGISKYKARKRETVNKLKATTEDLSRIEDVLFEINNNLAELEKQAKRAKKYFELREKYRASGLLLLFRSTQITTDKINTLSADIESEKLKVSDGEVQLRMLEADLEQFKKNHLDQEKSLSDFQKKVNSILDTIRSSESEIQIKEQKRNLDETQLTSISQNLLQYQTRIAQLQKDLDLLELEKISCQTDFEKIKIESSESEFVLLEKQEAYDNLKSGVDEFQNKKLAKEKLVFDLEKEMAIMHNQLENSKAEIVRNQEDLKTKNQEIQTHHTFSLDIDNKLQKSQEEIITITKAEDERAQKQSEFQLEVEKLSSNFNNANRRRDAKKNEYELLKSMVEKLEGFPESIKFLHHNWRNDVPVLADVIYTDEKYRNAIELFIEPYLNYYLVHSEAEAVHAIRLLFSNAKGKANFFILDKIQRASVMTKSVPGCKAAIDLVETEEIYKPLFNYLLHNVFINNEEKPLEDIVRYPDDISVISLSGSIVKQGNSITGGSVGLFEGKKLGRKKNLEKLELEIKEMELEVLELDRSVAQLKNEIKKIDLLTQKEQLTESRKKESELLQQKAQNETKLQHYNELIVQLEQKIAEHEHRNQINNQELIVKSDALNIYRKEYNELIDHVQQSDQVFDKVSTDLSLAQNKYNQFKLEELKWQNKIDNILKDISFKQQQFSEVDHQIKSDKEKEKNLNISIETVSEELKMNNSTLQEQYEFKKSMEVNLSSLEQEYYQIRNVISEYETKIRGTDKSIQELQSIINTYKDQRSELKYKIQSNVEKAEIEFHTKLDEFTADQDTIELDEEQLRDRSMYYKVRLDNYGEINPLALEAFEEMRVRHDKIMEQKLDILQAKESLLETITEIEETATANFLDSFNQVRVHFQKVFRSLFTEDDDCDLILMDENDPLECDIDIIAKPKGKRPKSIHQLSGGEKTLTAIALLFSLYLLKPAPFCVFDEVDAPLDDINIEKFNTIVRKFSDESQFIIITHNKLTMADVDVLYGVYMEEQGISAVTAVDFRKYDHEVVLNEMEG
ncbi:MAG: chromosome segregation protein SMC [Bacteroidota bacterium]|nr:chromosome segregation protein SMC [Bacteroidota bacterium]